MYHYTTHYNDFQSTNNLNLHMMHGCNTHTIENPHHFILYSYLDLMKLKKMNNTFLSFTFFVVGLRNKRQNIHLRKKLFKKNLFFY